MLKKYSTIFGKLMVWLYDLEMATYELENEESEKGLSVDERNDLSHILTVATNMSDELSLDAAATLCRRMWKSLNGAYSKGQVHKDLADLRSRLSDQLDARLFFLSHPIRLSITKLRCCSEKLYTTSSSRQLMTSRMPGSAWRSVKELPP